jgi:superoxide reductase
MAEQLEVYKCDACGNIVEVLHGGGGELVCCGEAMKLFIENTVDAAKEKHVPVIEKTADGFKVAVGEEPEATFCVDADQVTAREYCNLHGLWKA